MAGARGASDSSNVWTRGFLNKNVNKIIKTQNFFRDNPDFTLEDLGDRPKSVEWLKAVYGDTPSTKKRAKIEHTSLQTYLREFGGIGAFKDAPLWKISSSVALATYLYG